MVRYKKDLAGQLGNLLARCTAPALIPSGIVPVYNEEAVTKDDLVIQEQLKALPGKEKFRSCSFYFSNSY